MTLFAAALCLSGCFRPTPAVEPPPDFCQLTEDRTFTVLEFEWRSENAPGNLRYQVAQRELRRELC